MSHRVECGPHRHSRIVVGLFGNKLAAGRGVVSSNELIDQPPLLGPQLCVRLANVLSAAGLLGCSRGPFGGVPLALSTRRICREKYREYRNESSGVYFHRRSIDVPSSLTTFMSICSSER